MAYDWFKFDFNKWLASDTVNDGSFSDEGVFIHMLAVMAKNKGLPAKKDGSRCKWIERLKETNYGTLFIGGHMRRRLDELAPSTVATYRTRMRKLYLKVQSGQATTADRLELAELEALLGVRGSDIPPPGRPRKWSSR